MNGGQMGSQVEGKEAMAKIKRRRAQSKQIVRIASRVKKNRLSDGDDADDVVRENN